ncbi:MAG TPA: TolC family protein [Longimicrobiales bacterium]|nr:TolC family protein [Longimicrobiales bacterium]
MRRTAILLVAMAVLAGRAEAAEMPAVRAAPDTLALSLDEAVARALRDSDEIARAQATLLGAESQVTQATSGALPQLNSAVAYSRAIKTIFDDMGAMPTVLDEDIPPAFDESKTPKERFDLLSELMATNFMSALFAGLPFGRKNTYVATLSLTQPLYVGGKVGAALKVAEHYRAAARSQVTETEDDLVLQVRAAYLSASLAGRLAHIARESRRIAADHYRQVEDFREAGTASEFDLLRARVDLENRDPVVVQAENGESLALLELKRLVNIPPEQPLRLTSELDPSLVEVDESELHRLVLQRPILQAAENAVGMREQAVRIAKGDRLPTVAFQGNMGWQGFPDNALPPAWGDWRKDWSAGIAVSLPLFDGFRTRGRIDQAQADLRVAHVEEAQLKEGLALQTEAALAEYRSYHALILARRGTVALAERALELAEVRFSSGLSTQLEVSDAGLLLDQARVNEAQALFDYARALAQLERLSGGKMQLVRRGN